MHVPSSSVAGSIHELQMVASLNSAKQLEHAGLISEHAEHTFWSKLSPNPSSHYVQRLVFIGSTAMQFLIAI